MEDRRHFNRVMNKDIESRLLEDGFVRDAQNVININGVDGNTGAYENFRGNTLLEQNLTLGTNKVIGSCKDEDNFAIYYFVYNSNGNHGIYRYNSKLDTIDIILRKNVGLGNQFNLNFQDDRRYRINHANVVGDLLYWTDGYNPPRKISISKVSDQSADKPYLFIDDELITAIKYPPVAPPVATYVTDNDITVNLLRSKLFQFQYRYVFDDDEKSVFSPISKLPLPLGQELADGTWIENQSLNNTIRLRLENGGKAVRRIEVSAREGNIGDFFLIKKINVGDAQISSVPYIATQGSNIVQVSQTLGYDTSRLAIGHIISGSNFPTDTYVVDFTENEITLSEDAINTETGTFTVTSEIFYNFRNDSISEGLDQTDVIRPFDYVPQKAFAQEVIEENRLVYGNILEGYDAVDVDLDLSSNAVRIESSSIEDLGFNAFSYTSSAADGERWHYWWYRIQYLDIDVNSVYELSITAPNANGTASNYKTFTFRYIPKDGDVFEDMIDQFADSINSSVGASGNPNDFDNLGLRFYALTKGFNKPDINGWKGLRIRGNLKKTKNSPGAGNIRAKLVKTSSSSTFSGFKPGFSHDIGIVYYDKANRSGAVNLGTNSSLYIPSIMESKGGDLISEGEYRRHEINWAINHEAPLWATHYQLVYGGKQGYSSVFQYFIKSVTTLSDSNVSIDINTGIANTNEAVLKSDLPEYQFQKGDRLRFVYNNTQSGIIIINELIDVEIIGQDDNGRIIIDPIDLSDYDVITSATADRYTVAEIYTPKKDLGDTLFYEIGEKYEIGEITTSGGTIRGHRGPIQNQTISQPAKGTLSQGDIYVRSRYTVSGGNVRSIFVEDERFSDYYDSNIYNIGRPNAVSDEIRQKWLPNAIRFSGKKLQNSQINKLNRFDFDDIVEVKEAYGDIQRLIETGYVLKVLQPIKNTSIYIGRQETFNQDNSNNLIGTTSPLGSIRYPEEDYGTTYPESVIKHNRNIYFYDNNQGKVIRDAPNGMFPVSDYGMNSYFANKSIELQNGANSETLTVLGFYDEKYHVYGINFGEANDGDGTETVLFSEEAKGWPSFVTLYGNSKFPEHFENVGLSMVSFIDGQLWKHHSNELRNNFYGEQHNSSVKVVFNAASNQNKVFESLWVQSNKVWYCPNNSDIFVPVRDAYPQGMNSRLIKTKFREREGVWYAEFMRDINSKGFTSSQELEALLDGRRLRGLVLEVNLVNDDSSEVVLFESGVRFIPSLTG